jgi:hypothetical protein
MTPAQRLAAERAFRLSIDVEVQITEKAKSEPLQIVLLSAREQAAKAIVALVDVDPHDAPAVRGLQNEVRRYEDFVRWLQQMLTDGFEAQQALSEDAREALVADVIPDDIENLSSTTGHADD